MLNDTRIFAGTLEYDPSKGGYLKIIGLFKEIVDVGRTIDKKDIILGTTIDGKKMTLCNCVESQTTMNNGVFSTLYWVQIILDGVHLQTTELKFRTISVRLSVLDEWISIAGIEPKSGGNNYQLSIQIPDPYNLQINSELNVELIPSYSVNYGRISIQNKPLDISISGRTVRFLRKINE